ncbi:MAG: hypothetical protein V1755_04530 [Chloroflexota bacterium]
MKKAKKSTAKASSKPKARPRKAYPARSRAQHKSTSAGRQRAPARKAVPVKTKRPAKPGARMHSRSVAKLAAGVLSRRAAKAESLAKAVAAERPLPKVEPKVVVPRAGKKAKGAAAPPGRAHVGTSLPGNRPKRPVVRVSRPPQFTYMRAPGADSGFDVADSVEVFCDHELDGERVRGWVKGVVVQVDNKLVAVQFRSNVFLTDGWMVPDRILWYSLSSDQIRNTGVTKRGTRAAIPEY